MKNIVQIERSFVVTREGLSFTEKSIELERS